MNYFPWHIGDYAAHTRHLSLLEDLAYRRLLDLYYLQEKPLTGDAATIARHIGMRDNVEDVSIVLDEYFEKTQDGWRHERCEQEIAAAKEKSEEASARKENERERQRRHRERRKELFEKLRELNIVPHFETPTETLQSLLDTELSRVTEALRTQDATANQDPIPNTNNQKPIKNKKPLPIASAEVVEVFDHWRSVMSSPTSKLDKDRESLINKSLKLGYSVEDLKSAINGCRASPHNMGQNDRRTKYNGLNVILKSADNIDRFISVEKLRGGNDQPNQFSTGQRGPANPKPDTSAAGQVRAAIARERAATGVNPMAVANDVFDVRPQVGEQLRGGSGSGQGMGVVLEGSFTRAD